MNSLPLFCQGFITIRAASLSPKLVVGEECHPRADGAPYRLGCDRSTLLPSKVQLNNVILSLPNHFPELPDICCSLIKIQPTFTIAHIDNEWAYKS